MTITTTLAQNLRSGILKGKLDLATGPDCRDHEPALAFPPDPMTGTLMFNRAEEKAYRHVVHDGPNTA
jgi:hypothetical protein